ncbi:MAG: response regulator [Candidatus Latescibacteria bacterium]|nr:response regulator [Candidatus Latescibacterota bacterium]
MAEKGKILIVDDHPANIKALRLRLEAAQHQVVEADSGSQALAKLADQRPDLVLLDIMMPGMDGYEVCRRIKERPGESFVPVIMLTARSDTESLVKALELGADEYITKPFQPLELMARVQSMLRIRRMYQENTFLKEEIAAQHRFDQIIGRSRAMRDLGEILAKVVDSQVTVLLTGESGTGKETIARSIHYNGGRREGRFVAVNCGALSDHLLESELFGHRRGAFTGAYEDRAGLFEAATGGTVFLDEIGETSPAMQVRLLRVLQEGEVTRVGESRVRPVDARVVAATNRNLPQEVQEGRFREDLYYRLGVFPIHLPALRQRLEDIPLLAQFFLQRHTEANGKPVQGFTPRALEALGRYDWPGNVRELENEIERALVLVASGGAIDIEMLSEKIQGPRASIKREGRLQDIVAQVEREAIDRAFTDFAGNKSRMAAHLGISRWTLLQKMKAYGVGGEGE